jgi:hypothetical protein
MKDRTWNRREFAVTPNGLFSILRPTGWFSTVRLPGGFRYRVGLTEKTEFPLSHENPTKNALGNADGQETAILSQTMKLSTPDYRLVRTVLIFLAATAITLIVLW